MSYQHPIETIVDDVLVVGVKDENDCYIMWQKGLTADTGADDGVYFECDDQSNGDYNHLGKCIIEAEGIQVIYRNQEEYYLKFPPDFKEHESLYKALLKVYTNDNGTIILSL